MNARIVAVAVVAQGLLWILATPGPLRIGGAQLGPAYAVQAVVLSAAILFAATAAIARMEGLDREALGWTPPNGRRWWAVAAVALAAIAIGMLWGGTVDRAAFADDYPWPSVAWLQGDPGRWAIWAAGYALYYAAYEGFYRGAVLAWAQPRLGATGANVLQTVLSTLVHAGKPLPELLAAIPAGLAFGTLRQRSGSLAPVIVLHLGIGLTLDLLMVRGP